MHLSHRTRSPAPCLPARLCRLARAGAWALALGAAPSLAQDTARPVETLRLTADPAAAATSFFGSVRAREISSLSYGARGCIVEVSDTAKRERVAQAGQVLVRLDDRRSQLAVRTAQARLQELSAAVDERQLAVAAARADERRRKQELDFVAEEFERSSAMLGRGLINESTMDTVERRYMDARFAAERASEAIANAEAAMKRAEIALEIGQLDKQSADIALAEFTLSAPFDGILVGFDPNVGDCVQEGELAARIYVPDQKSVDVYLQISRLTDPGGGGLSVGSEVTVTRVNGQACGGRITQIDTEADLENQHVQLTVDVEESCAPTLFLNESVEIEAVETAALDTFTVPNAAVSDMDTVFLVDEASGRLVEVAADIVHRGARATTLRLPDARGRLLVTGGEATLADGLEVQVSEPG